MLAISGVVATACGSDDDKKPERDYSSAGDGGADASGGGSSSVEAGSGGSLNQAGDSTVTGGEAGTGSVEPMGGTASTGAGGEGGAGNVTPFHGLYIGEERVTTRLTVRTKRRSQRSRTLPASLSPATRSSSWTAHTR